MPQKDNKIILVDRKDKGIGLAEKLECHLGKGKLHRAFSVFIFNKKEELLLQQRSAKKMLWPGFWSNTCCSHPKMGENFQKAGRRRLKEEMGFNCPLRVVGRFQYHAKYKNVGSEYELCYVLEGSYQGKIKANKKEVADCRWVSLTDLRKEIRKNPRKFTPWFKTELKKFFKAKKHDFKK